MPTPQITNVSLSEDFQLLRIKTTHNASTITINPRCDKQRHTLKQRNMLKLISNRGNRVLKKMNELVRSIYDMDNEVFEFKVTDLIGEEHRLLRPHNRYYVRKKDQDKSKEMLRLLYRVVFEQFDAYRLKKKQSPVKYSKIDLNPYIIWISLTQLSPKQMKTINMLSNNKCYGNLDVENWKVISND